MNDWTDKIIYSFVVLTYERPALLTQCLSSIVAQQFDKSKFEVIVIDDGSRINNLPIINEFKNRLRLSYIKQSHQGISTARNSGIKNSKGNYIVIVDDDYLLPINYLATVDHFFHTHPEAYVVSFIPLSCGKSIFRHVQQTYTDLALLRTVTNDENKSGVFRSSSCPACCATFKRKIFDKIGYFDEELSGGEDFDFSLRMKEEGIPVFLLPDAYVKHWENKSLFSFLEQRFQYGINFFDVRAKHRGMPENIPSNFLKFIFFIFFRILFFTFNTFSALFRTAIKTKCSLRFVLFSPIIILFSLFFCIGFYFKAASSMRKPLPKRQSNR